jgi:acetoin utilization deacetylase AcuC-like enzyme
MASHFVLMLIFSTCVSAVFAGLLREDTHEQLVVGAKMLGGMLAGLGLPTVLVLEGGYAVAEIGENVAGVLGAFAGRGP